MKVQFVILALFLELLYPRLQSTVTREPMQMNPWARECPELTVSNFIHPESKTLNLKNFHYYQKVPAAEEKADS